MSVTIIGRSGWGAEPWNGSPAHVALGERTEFFVHYDGGHPVTRTGNEVPRAIDRQHHNQGWAGIGYNFVVDQDGRIFEGRGWVRQGAHCPGHNRSGIGVQIAVGGDQEPSAAALAACRALYDEACAKTGRTLAMKGHRDGFATQCPGSILYAWVQAGMPAEGYQPQDDTPPEPWDGKEFPGRDAFRLGHTHPAVTVLGERLVAHGFGRFYQVGPGPRFTNVDKAAVEAFQEAQGWTGTDADGYPGPVTWERLMAAPATSPRRRVVDLSRLREAARENPPMSGTPCTYSGVRIVEAALVDEGLLAERRSDGHFGTATIAAYAAWQRRLGYRGRAADGIPGKTSLTRLGKRHGFDVRN